MTHATIELINAEQNGNPKEVYTTFDVDLTDDEVQELRDSYQSSQDDEESLFDRMYCDKVSDAGDKLAKKMKLDYGWYDYGTTILTFSDGSTETIENYWWR